jgi:hypothetical protein
LTGEAHPSNAIVFRYGYAFSVGSTLWPIPLFAIGWVLKWFIR